MPIDLSLGAYEQAIKQVKSVIAARIKTNRDGEIEEVHVLAGPGRNPKQIVRDIESVLEAQFDLQVDHKKISVAQVEDEDQLSVETPEMIRPKLVGVTLRTINSMAEAKVELSAGPQLLYGTITGPATSHNKLRLFVEATIQALATLTLESCMFVAEDVVITNVAKHQVAMVVITLVNSTGEQSLSGCAMVRSDDREAVVKATLDAVNRKLKFLQNV
ncbi:MAG: hypothetical protein M0Z55_00555 [Peptococcaceae bacterium]|nr:hypothetical protein [Peptococcaceae bacterium]